MAGLRNDQRRPAGGTGVEVVGETTASVAERYAEGESSPARVGRCPHGKPDRPGVCRRCLTIRRRDWRELNAITRPDPQPSRGPATYGLEGQDLRSEANRLHAEGWPLAEVESVLAVERRSA